MYSETVVWIDIYNLKIESSFHQTCMRIMYILWDKIVYINFTMEISCQVDISFLNYLDCNIFRFIFTVLEWSIFLNLKSILMQNLIFLAKKSKPIMLELLCVRNQRREWFGFTIFETEVFLF